MFNEASLAFFIVQFVSILTNVLRSKYKCGEVEREYFTMTGQKQNKITITLMDSEKGTQMNW